jgi:hypothetical protein
MAVAPWGWVALAIAIVGVIVWAQGHQVNQLKPENTPREAIDYVTQAQIHGKVFNYYNMGG